MSEPIPRTVLLVEDDPAVRNVLSRRLKRWGHTVIECMSGDDGVRTAASHTGAIDVMLCDMVMPGLTGAEAADVITRTRSELPVIFMSGYLRDDAMAAACRGPNRYFLEKPFEAEALAALLDRVLEVGDASRHDASSPGHLSDPHS